MAITEMAKDAFVQQDWVNGALSGGIEAPRVLLDAREMEDGSVELDYTYQPTCGLSDCRYHDTRAEKKYTDKFQIKENTLYLNGDSDIFKIRNWKDTEIHKITTKFYRRWKLKVPY